MRSSSQDGKWKNSTVSPTVSRAGVEPVVDIERAGFAGDGCGHGLVGVVLILGEEDVQRRGGDNLRRVLGILAGRGH